MASQWLMGVWTVVLAACSGTTSGTEPPKAAPHQAPRALYAIGIEIDTSAPYVSLEELHQDVFGSGSLLGKRVRIHGYLHTGDVLDDEGEITAELTTVTYRLRLVGTRSFDERRSCKGVRPVVAVGKVERNEGVTEFHAEAVREVQGERGW